MVHRLHLIVLSLALAALASFLQIEAIVLDIHLPLETDHVSTKCPYSQSLTSNLALRRAFDSSECIDLLDLHVAHLTLYQAAFDLETTANGTTAVDPKKLDRFLGALRDAAQEVLPQCDVSLVPTIDMKGAYAMWPVNSTDCLQTLSDEIVDAMAEFISRPPPVPDWIYQLPEPERTRKMGMVERYGSPNVFGEFEPHVTVSYNMNTTAIDRGAILDRFGDRMPRPCDGLIRHVAVGRTGVGGSVLRRGVIDVFPLRPNDGPIRGDRIQASKFI